MRQRKKRPQFKNSTGGGRGVSGGVPLVILSSPYRSFPVLCLAHIGEICEKDPDVWATVIPPEIIPAKRRQPPP